MSAASPTRALVRRERRRQAGGLAIASLAAAGAAAAAGGLLGLSGWFLTSAAVAGAAGPAAVGAFNYLLPSAAIRFLAIARTGLRYVERLTSHAAALRALAQIRPALFAGIAAAPAREALAVSSGEATARLVQDVDAIENVFVRLSAPWASVSATIVASGLIGLASLPAAWLFLAGVAIQIGLGAWIGRVRSRAPAIDSLRAAGALKDRLHAFAAASTELRCYDLQDAVVDHLMTLDAALGNAKVRAWSATSLIGAVQPLLTGFVAAGVLVLCAHAPLALAALAALSAAIGLDGASGLMLALDRSGAVDAAAARLDAMMAPAPNAPVMPIPAGPADLILILDGRPHRLAACSRWGLVGPSGAGKTRLLQDLLRLGEPAAGTALIGGQDLRDLDPAAVRALFAYAPQDAAMIAGSVRANLAVADPAADDAAMWRVLSRAELADKVRQMPAGLDAWIGEGGSALSGGERRRLSLARALLRPAPWLLLDEPTESLDAHTEAKVVANLAAHLAETDQGLILVSHRPLAMSLVEHRLVIHPAGPAPLRRAG